jgi:hypothetical protein
VRPVSQAPPFVLLVWAIYGAVLVATLVTYFRLPPGATYRFEDTGVSGAVSRAVTYMSFPVAPAALAVLATSRLGWPALPVAALCAVGPAVASTSHLEARWVDAPVVVGVALAVALTVRARRGPAGRLSPLRVALLALLVVWSVPWLIAAAGLYAQDLPLLGHLVNARQPTPGEAALASVHRGLHEGLFGAQLAATALLLSVGPVRTLAAAYLSLMLAYGLAVTANDGWNEQLVKRGWVHAELPDVLTPGLSPAWAGLLVAAALIYVLWFGREQRAPGALR